MKTFIKVLLVIAGACFAFGAIFFSIGIGFGGFQLKNTITNLTTVSYQNYEKEFTGDVKSLEFELGAGDIKVVKGDKFSLSATNVLSGMFDNARIDEEGTLRIEDDAKYTFFNIVEYEGAVTITIPEDFKAEKIYIQTGAGNIDITDLTASDDISFNFGAGNVVLGDITAGDEVYIVTGAGNTICNNITGEKVEIDTGVGEFSSINGKITAKDLTVQSGVGAINLGDIKADNFKISGGVGEINVNNADVKSGELDIGTGDFSITTKIGESLDYDGGVGSSDITIVGEEEDFRITVSQGAGDITIGDNSYSAAGSSFSIGKESAPKTIDIDNGVGDFEITFTSEMTAEKVTEDKAA